MLSRFGPANWNAKKKKKRDKETEKEQNMLHVKWPESNWDGNTDVLNCLECVTQGTFAMMWKMTSNQTKHGRDCNRQKRDCNQTFTLNCFKWSHWAFPCDSVLGKLLHLSTTMTQMNYCPCLCVVNTNDQTYCYIKRLMSLQRKVELVSFLYLSTATIMLNCRACFTLIDLKSW